ncbi:WhiB family transcriptional regulator [Microbacterium sp. A84]|uniref:WhiB family transcriptional regulator n=1 Tax=Microbacterium sp. A84 TaxID=3450715 RepID=UPI003F6E04E4
MTAEEAAWDALNSAPEHYTPPCDGRALFTADRLSDDELALCTSICAACPLLAECDAYATAAGVKTGFWAGHAYTNKGKSL